MWWWTKSQIAWTRAQPVGPEPNSRQAVVGELVGLAVAAAEQVDQGVFGQVLDRRPAAPSAPRVGQAVVVHQRVGAQVSRPRGAMIRLHQLPNRSR
jgi:hypothetical protein